MSNSLEIPGIWDVVDVLQGQTIDHTPHLQALWLTEDQITPELLTRFQEALRLYQATPEANLALLEERVMWDLDTATASTQEKITALTQWISEQEENAPNAWDLATTAIDRAQAAATTAIRTEVENGIRGFFAPMRDWFNNNAFGRILKSALLAILPAALATRFFWQTPAPVPAQTGADPVVAPPAPQPEPIVPAWSESIIEDDEIVTLETRRFAFYKSGASLILSLNGENEQENTSINGILGWLETMPFSEILTLNPDWLSEEERTRFFGESVEEGEVERLASIISNLQSNTTETLLRVGLSPSSIQNIIAPNGEMNERLFEYFGETPEAGEERLTAILNIAQSGNFDWRQLTFSEISKLYISSIPALRIPAVNTVGETFSEVRGFFGDGVVAETFPPAMYIIPWHILEGFARGMGTDITTNRYIHSENSEVIQTVLWESPSEADRAIIERVISMKEYLLGDFIDNPRLRLSDAQKALFRENLDYTSVLSLYSIMGWIPDIAAINTISLPVLLYAVSRVIGSGNGSESFQWTLYLGNYVREALLSWEENGLSEDEVAVLEIYGRRMLDIILLSHLDGVAQTMGLASGISWLPLTELWITAFAGGAVTNLIGRRMIAHGISNGRISMAGSIFRRIWLLGMVVGAVTGGTWLIVEWTPSVAFSHDIEEAAANNDINRFLEVLERHRESIQEYTTPDGQRMVVSAYPGETPFVVFNNKVYILSVWNRDLLESARDSAGRLFSEGDGSSLLDLWTRILWLNPTGTIDGVNFEIQRYEDGNIIFWEWEHQYTIPLNELLQIQDRSPDLVGNDIAHVLSEGAYTLPLVGSEWVPGYILNTIGDNHVLFLREIWNVWDASISS